MCDTLYNNYHHDAIKVRVTFLFHYHDSENVCVSQTNENLRESESLMLIFFYYKD